MSREMTHRAVLCVGANLNGESNVPLALAIIAGMMTDVRKSEIYSTPAVGGGERPYVNAVVEGDVCMEMEAFNGLLKKMELDFGRTPEARSAGYVPLDVDIVMWDDTVVRPNDYSQRFFQIGYSSLLPVQG